MTIQARAIRLRMRDLASGALIAGVVEHAILTALRRDAEEGKKKPSGLTTKDIAEAVALKLGELRHSDHREAIAEILAGTTPLGTNGS